MIWKIFFYQFKYFGYQRKKCPWAFLMGCFFPFISHYFVFYSNRFGGYINSKITSIDTFIKDQNAFIFSLKSNNRLPGPAKFDIKHPNSAFISITTHKRYIFAFGGGYDIKLDSKKTADQANSNPSSYDFGNNKNALYGKIYPNRFTPKKWVVYQME